MSEIEQQPPNDQPVEDIGEDINVTTIVTVGVVTALVIVIVIMLLVGLFHQSEKKEIQIKTGQAPELGLDEIAANQKGRLGSYDWVDPEAGTVSIPIDKAMDLAVAEYGSGEPLPALDLPHGQDPAGTGSTGEEEEHETHNQ